MTLALRLFLLLCLMAGAIHANARPLSREQVPAPLAPWVDWVLHAHPELDCPVNYDNEQRRCVWPGTLRLRAHNAGATFTQSVTVLAPSRITLPGNLRHWPVEISVAQEAVAVVADKGQPALDLDPGSYEISGRFAWSAMPDRLQLGAGTGIVELTIDGRTVPVQRQADQLRLRAAGSTRPSSAPEDALELLVRRLVTDGRPLTVTTALTLSVSGRQREVSLPNVLLGQAVPMQLKSPLPARLDTDGKLTLQVRPGNWTVQITERHAGQIDQLRAPSQAATRANNSGAPAQSVIAWPDEEIWLWKADPSIRIAEVSGPVSIDPRQVELPGNWQGLPGFRLKAGQSFDIATVRRGDPTPEPDQLTMQRALWLDFDGGGFSVQDRISGRLNSTWRLDTDQGMTLGQALIDGEPQFITRAAGQDHEGIEVRRGQLQLLADSRIELNGDAAGLRTSVPALGWQHDFQKINTVLHTPPGWQVLAVSGVDRARGAWLDAWTLYDLFLVLIIAIAAGRLFGWPWAVLSCLLLALLWHEPMAPRLSWLTVLIPIALLRVVPAQGRLAQGLRVAYGLAMAALLIVLLPFVIGQARTALHPQLEKPESSAPMMLSREREVAEARADAEMADQSIRREAKVESMASSRLKNAYAKGAGVSAAPLPAAPELPLTDPKAVVQTGPGIPDWHWNGITLEFNGPVLAGQSLSITLLSPTLKRFAHWTILVLVALMLWRLAGARRPQVAPANLAAAAMLLLALPLLPPDANAAEFPPESMLSELAERLTENQTQAPRAAIAQMHLQTSERQLEVSLRVHALQQTVVPLPADTQRLLPARIALNGVDAASQVLADQAGQIWMMVPGGVSQVTLSLHLPALNQIELSLPLVPHKVTTSTADWTVTGLDSNGVPGRQLTLIREQQTTQAATEALEPVDLPALLEVTRVLRLGLTWQVQTTVKRLSPLGAPVSVNIGLLDGEQLTTGGLVVKDRQVRARLGARERQMSWVSRLETNEALTLQAPQQDQWVETWQLEAGPIWHVELDGIAPIHHQNAARQWLPTWKPWPGEVVNLRVSRPLGVAGQSVTIDNSRLSVKPGIRATDTELNFTLRSSQGGRHVVTLPPEAALQSVRINGQPRAIRPDGRSVALPVVPGTQTVRLHWRENSGVSTVWQAPHADLGTANVNARLAVEFPQDRWTLWTSGPRLGPAVLFWGVLLVILVASVALGRLARKRLPLGAFGCFLLLVGMSQVPLVVPIIVLLWFALVAARPKLMRHAAPLSYNAVQIVAGLLTLIALAALLTAVQQGLLGQPDMQIAGYGSNATRLNWYLDRSTALTPEASIISVPLWVYRVLMLLWALWLAWSTLNWARWGWQQFGIGGLWRKRESGPSDDSGPHGPAGGSTSGSPVAPASSAPTEAASVDAAPTAPRTTAAAGTSPASANADDSASNGPAGSARDAAPAPVAGSTTGAQAPAASPAPAKPGNQPRPSPRELARLAAAALRESDNKPKRG